MNRINTKKRAGKLAIFLFFTFLSLTTVAQNKEKKITVQNKRISLKEAFAQIETQTGYSIAYEQSNLDIEKKRALSLKNVTVDKAMTQLLKETGYVYKIKGLILAACSSRIAIGYFTIMSQFKLILADSELNCICCIKNGNRYK